MWNYYSLYLAKNREKQHNVLMWKWRLFFIGTLLFLFTALIFGNPLPDDVTDYPKTFQERLENAQRVFQAEQWHNALRLYRALAKEAPEFPIVHIGEGDAAAKLKD